MFFPKIELGSEGFIVLRLCDVGQVSSASRKSFSTTSGLAKKSLIPSPVSKLCPHLKSI